MTVPRSGSAAGPRLHPVPAVILGGFALVAIGMVVAALALYFSYANSLPDIGSLADYNPEQGSVVVSADGTDLATFAITNRKVVTYEQIPTVIVEATVAAEDRTFWDNPCVDPRAIVRAFLQNISAGEVISGASTICQQVVKNLLLPADLLADPGRQLERKLKEAMLALRLDAAYAGREGKEQIMEIYLNQIYYGNQAYGVWSAMDRYFGKDFLQADPTNEITVGDASLVAGLVRAPSHLDPTLAGIPVDDGSGGTVLFVPDSADCIRVQGYVLAGMEDLSYITSAQRTAVQAESVYVQVPVTPRYLAPHFVNAVRREAAELLGSEGAIDRAGLQIETTLDYTGYQLAAEKWASIGYDLDRMTDAELEAKYGAEALTWIKTLQDKNINNDAIVTLNYRTGAVIAYVGSANFYGEATPQHQGQYDVAGVAYRQSGSAFKPLTWATGFERGDMTPATMFMDVSTEIVPGYQVHDADHRERGPVRARDALKYSLNIPVTKAQQIIGTDNVVAQAERLGLKWDPKQGDPRVASLTLGTIGVRMLDLAGAYGALANDGRLMPSYMIERITDAHGVVIYDHATDHPAPVQAISAGAAYLTTDILADNTDPNTNPLWGPRFQLRTADGRRPATLKTGTTTDFKDLQAFGYLAADADPALDEGAIVTGVWIGNSDDTSIDSVFAADGPTWIWHDYMTEVTAANALPVRDFVRPDGITEFVVDAYSGMAPGEFTTKTVTEIFMPGTVPNAQDDRHRELAIEAATGKIWMDGCGDFVTASPSPGSSPTPGGPPGNPGGPPDPGPPAVADPELKVYLDLVGWDAGRPTWEASNIAWIENWIGRESELPRRFVVPLDVPLAPTETCAPGEVPTSTPIPSPSPTPTATPEPTIIPTETPIPSPSPTPGPTP